jgi:hypothetical protein
MIKAFSKLRERLKARRAKKRPTFMGDTLSRWALRFSLFGLLPPTLSFATICYSEGFQAAQSRLNVLLLLFSLFALFLSIIAVKMNRDLTKKMKEINKGHES